MNLSLIAYEKGVSEKDLAKGLGVSDYRAKQYLNNSRCIPANRLIRVAEVLGLDIVPGTIQEDQLLFLLDSNLVSDYPKAVMIIQHLTGTENAYRSRARYMATVRPQLEYKARSLDYAQTLFSKTGLPREVFFQKYLRG